MENPNFDPMQPAPPKPPRRRSIVGPVILIVLGLAFLVSNLGLFHLDIWNVLWRLWPVWLIAVGLDLVIGRNTRWGTYVVLGVVIAVIGGAVWLDNTGLLWSTGTGHGPVAVSVPLDTEAKRADVQIHSGVARLRITGSDSDKLVSGEIRPLQGERIAQDGHRSGDTAYFTVRSQGEGIRPVIGSVSPTWDLQLSNKLPMALEMETGVGESDIDLSGLTLTDLTVKSGVGKMVVTLPSQGQFNARIEGGVGGSTVYIPKGMAARILVRTGIGHAGVSGDFLSQGRDLWISPGYDTAANRVFLTVNGGVGAVDVIQR